MHNKEEIEKFRQEVLPEYERYLKELDEQKKANEKLGTVVKQCRICGKFKKLSAFYKNPLALVYFMKEQQEKRLIT